MSWKQETNLAKRLVKSRSWSWVSVTWVRWWQRNGQRMEHIFQEVVHFNPVSSVPILDKKEIVSYYFNVFILRKQVEHNRVDPMNNDSDNDEWQGRDDDGDDEGAMTDDDEDSAVESPIHHGDPGYHEKQLAEHEEDTLDETSADDDNLEFGYSKSEPYLFQAPDKTPYDDAGNNDTHDGACTSLDSGGPSQGTQVKCESFEQWGDYVLKPCDSKVWDGFMNCPKNKVDLLPTCSMINKLFEDAGFDLQGKRW